MSLFVVAAGKVDIALSFVFRVVVITIAILVVVIC